MFRFGREVVTTMSCVSMKVMRLFEGMCLLLFFATGRAMPQSPPVQQLINELPLCSVLRSELQRGVHGEGIKQPYMDKMGELGVQRAMIEVRAVRRRNRPQGMQVVRRLFYRRFDGPDAQISDEGVLNAIGVSGLEADLDRIARNRVSTAPIVKAGDWPVRSKRLVSFVEFFADPWMPEQPALLFALSGSAATTTSAVVESDAPGTRALLKSNKFSKKELDRSLFDAVLSRYDNSTVIKLLMDAGADANARNEEGTTPLMNAVARPCNLRPLLDGGANLYARDKWGKTALDHARETKATVAEHLLEEAGANTRSDNTPLDR